MEVENGEEVRVLEIPIKNTDDMIDVPVDSLPDDVDKIVDVLKAEEPELWRWIQFAVEYYRQGKTEQFEQILRVGCSGDVDLRYTDDTKGRIAMLNAYAAFKISQGKAEWLTNRTKGEQLLTDAVEYLNRADRINNMADSTWVNKGVLNMVRGQEQNALRDFSNALEINPGNLVGMLGKAAVLFQMKQYREARDHYMRAIRTHPGCDASVRFGLGLCFYELKQPSRAIECFQRTLQLDPNNVDALVALAVLELNKATKEVQGGGVATKEQEAAHQLVVNAMQRLQKAYQLDSSCPMVLNHLSNHFFQKDNKDYARIDNLARTAYRTSENSRVQAEACYIIGRNGHDQGYLEVAQKFYNNALSSWPEFPLAKYGQLKLHPALAPGNERASVAEVVKALEELMKDKDMQNQADLKFMLGALYARDGSPKYAKEASRLLAEAADEMPDNPEVWIEYAQHKQAADTKADAAEALRAYKRALKLLRRAKQRSPAEVQCNVGVLLFKRNDLEGALEAFREALVAEHQPEGDPTALVSALDGPDGADRALEMLQEKTVTIVYNIGLALEALGRLAEAERLYQAVKDKFPFYTDCHLRLGQLAERRGLHSDAADWYREASGRGADASDAWALLGNLDRKKGDKRGARAKFEQLVKQRHLKHDAYARLSIGNLALASAMGKPGGPEAERGLREALGIFRAVLTLNHRNIFAANGVGVVLALRGQVGAAQKVFDKVREVGDTLTPAVWVNMAHLAMQDGKYQTAASMYEQCLRRFFADKDPEVLNYLANAKYSEGKFLEAKDVMLRALKESPEQLKYWYNLAVVEESYGAKILNIKPDKRTLAEVEAAMASLQHAYEVFTWLAAMVEESPSAKPGESDLVHEPSTPPGSPSVGKARPDPELMPTLLELASDHKKRKYQNLPLVDTTLTNKNMRPVEKRTGSAVFKRASKAKEHADWVGSTIKKAAKHVERQRRLERQKEQERRKHFEASRAAEAKRAAEQEAERKKKEEEDQARMAAALELEEANRKLVQKYLEEEQMQKQAAKERETKTKTRKKRGKKTELESESSGEDSSDDDVRREPPPLESSDSTSDDERRPGKRRLAIRKDSAQKKRIRRADESDLSSSDEEGPPKVAVQGAVDDTTRKPRKVLDDSDSE